MTSPLPATLATTKPGIAGTVGSIRVGDYAWHQGAFRRVDVLHARSGGGIYAVKYAGVRKYARVVVGSFEMAPAADIPVAVRMAQATARHDALVARVGARRVRT